MPTANFEMGEQLRHVERTNWPGLSVSYLLNCTSKFPALQGSNRSVQCCVQGIAVEVVLNANIANTNLLWYRSSSIVPSSRPIGRARKPALKKLRQVVLSFSAHTSTGNLTIAIKTSRRLFSFVRYSDRPKRKPGAVRDAIIDALTYRTHGATVAQITEEVSARLGPTPASSIRSYLRLNTPKLFVKVDRGHYGVREKAQAVLPLVDQRNG